MPGLKRIAVVGGGVTGCIAAMECASRGHRVTLYEKTAHLGGVLRDIVADGDVFLNGCQYFVPGTPWFERLRRRLSVTFRAFDHTYGSYTDLIGSRNLRHDFAQPVFSGPLQPVRRRQDSPSVAARLAAYPPTIAEALRAWASGFGDLDRLHENCLDPMQIGRIFFEDALDGVVAAKRDNPTADIVYGVPRHILLPTAAPRSAAIPAEGYDALFEALAAWLTDAGVTIRTGAAATAVARDGVFRLVAGGDPIDADQVVWSTNPSGLMIRTGAGRLEAPPSRMFCAVGDLAGDAPANPHYIQVFSRSSAITRVFSYSLNGRKLTIEGFDGGQSDAEIEADIHSILANLNITGRFSLKRVVRQARYVNSTLNDAAVFARFEKMAPDLGIIPGGWQFYGRDQKLKAILTGLGVEH